MPRVPLVQSKTYSTPRRPFEKERLDQELKLIGEYGLRNKREVWRVKYSLANIRKGARELLTLEEKDPKRLFEGKELTFCYGRKSCSRAKMTNSERFNEILKFNRET